MSAAPPPSAFTPKISTKNTSLSSVTQCDSYRQAEREDVHMSKIPLCRELLLLIAIPYDCRTHIFLILFVVVSYTRNAKRKQGRAKHNFRICYVGWRRRDGNDKLGWNAENFMRHHSPCILRTFFLFLACLLRKTKKKRAEKKASEDKEQVEVLARTNVHGTCNHRSPTTLVAFSRSNRTTESL